eukprot:67235-Amorphochlora_amoeboformis.AAC.1
MRVDIQKECKRSTGPLLPCPKSIKSGAGELGGKARDLEEEPYGGYDSRACRDSPSKYRFLLQPWLTSLLSSWLWS